jgi:GT2 family glycosyltransferase
VTEPGDSQREGGPDLSPEPDDLIEGPPAPGFDDRTLREEILRAVADRIVAAIGPRRVLDVGGEGYLVAALRELDVEAFRVDLSGSARGPGRADSADLFDDKYDLIVCLGALEPLTDEEARHAVASICRSTSDVLFATAPVRPKWPSGPPLRPGSWWIAEFDAHGFRLDIDFDGAFAAPDAMRFRAGPTVRTTLDALLLQRHGLLGELAALRHTLGSREAAIADLHALCERLRAEEAGRRQQGEDKDKLIAGLNFHLLAIQRTVGWKVLERLRRVRDLLVPPDSRRRDLYWLGRRLLEVLLDEGPSALLQKARYKLRLLRQGQTSLIKAPSREMTFNLELRYPLWVERHRVTATDLTRMQAELASFRYAPVISIVTPVHDTDERWLRRMIESVRCQIYPHWELCLVNDGSSKAHVQTVLDEYAAIEPRVQVKHLTRNHGIAGASTRGLDLATGEFVALLDHDDELPPDALFEVAARLNEDPDLDLIYSDEDKLDPDGRRVEPLFKPDWSPDLLLSMNYITHLSVFRRLLLGEVGGFRPGLDGSQDYDLLLRFTERTCRIAHIPKILYHWRKTRGSVAASTAAKPFAYEAGCRAIEDAVRRRGDEARVEAIRPGLYAVRYRLAGTPLVSIIIPTRDRWPLLDQCLRSIEEKTSYRRYEILVLDNDTTEPHALNGLNAIAGKWRVYRRPGPFNFSALNNFGAAEAHGEHLVFLNNDTQVVKRDWLTALLEHAQRPEVGAVGARLHYPDGRIQHAGLVLGVGGVADHAFKGLPGDRIAYFGFPDAVRNVSGVTAACMMVPRRAFEVVGGFDERLQVALNDVDLCLRLRERGYRIVCTPFALLYHHESGTRGRLHPSKEEELVWSIWGDAIRRGDPYYNPNLTLSRTDWSLAD